MLIFVCLFFHLFVQIVASSPDNKSKSENIEGPITAEQEPNVNSSADERSFDNLQRNQSSSLSSTQQQQQHAVPPPLNGLISSKCHPCSFSSSLLS